MKKLLSVLICAVLCLTLFTACGNKNKAEDEIYIPIRSGNKVNYDTAHAYVGTILEEVYLEGTFSSPYSVDLAFTMTGGTVEQFNVRVDQDVKKGDVIATLSDDALEEEITIQKLKLDSAKATYETLLEKDPDGDETKFSKIEYDIEQAEYDALVEQRNWLVITAPFDGRVTYSGDYWWGASIRQNATVCTIVDTSRQWLTVTDNRNSLTNVSFGTAVKIKQGALVDTTGHVVDVRTEDVRWGGESFTVNQYVIQVDDESAEFEDLGGIEVIFTTLRRDDAVIVPSNAVYETDEGYYVNVLIDNVKVQVTVTIGIVSGDKTEILTGLDGSETIIL